MEQCFQSARGKIFWRKRLRGRRGAVALVLLDMHFSTFLGLISFEGEVQTARTFREHFRLDFILVLNPRNITFKSCKPLKNPKNRPKMLLPWHIPKQPRIKKISLDFCRTIFPLYMILIQQPPSPIYATPFHSRNKMCLYN